MGSSLWLMLLFQAVLVGLNAVFACAEIAVISMDEKRIADLADRGDKRAGRLLKLTGEPAKCLGTIQVAVTLSGFMGSAFAADNFSDSLVDLLLGLGLCIPKSTLDTIVVVGITLVLSYFTLVFGELVPKRAAMKNAEELALKVSGLLHGISIAFAPVVWFLTLSTNAVLKLMGVDTEEKKAD